ncbi:DUF559 domain-containing protein [Singulisphaera sp. Ch08]|uniref:DUF559 domain-containing protein n=1 Tax=Singulisphaera sp. Ch08 TaxID=3120278 RepID=A0AAU7C7B3_9BACT
MNLPGYAVSLDRHQQRRAAGLPTVSVLCGAAGLTLPEGRRWAEQGGRPLISLSSPRFERILEAWVDHLSAGRDLIRDAIAWLVRESGRSDSGSIEELTSRIRRMAPIERTAFFDSVLADASTSSAGTLCRWLIERYNQGESITEAGLTTRLSEAFAGSDDAGAREQMVMALKEVIPSASAHDPVLLLARDDEQIRPAAWVESAALSLARIALWQPSTATILAIESGEFDDYCRTAPESRAKALVRAGVIAIHGLGEDEIVRRLATELPESAAHLGESVRRLVADGASDGLVSRFVDAARAAVSAASSPLGEEGSDLARSAAERFLFERLGSLPATAGLFELNAALDFRFGPSRAMEVDLLARTLGLAVEIDGYYHFQDPDAYRRDRRKDVELQKRGYLVVRVLAEDVVSRLEDVLRMILEAVASRGDRNTHRQRGEAS